MSWDVLNGHPPSKGFWQNGHLNTKMFNNALSHIKSFSGQKRRPVVLFRGLSLLRPNRTPMDIGFRSSMNQPGSAPQENVSVSKSITLVMFGAKSLEQPRWS
jgi:hypothetical protein